MSKKNIAVSVSAVILAVAIIAGASALASPGYGTQSDPFVTLSYINTTVSTAFKAEITSAAASAKTTVSALFDEQMKSLTALVDARLKSSTPVSAGDVFSVVSLSNGKTLTCNAGTEIMLRVGSAVSAGGSAPRLVNTTDGTTVEVAGTALVKNNLYMVTINGNGVKATSDAKLLVRGSYTIG